MPFPPIQSYPATGVVPAITGGRRRGGGICLRPRSVLGVLGSPGFSETKEPIEDQNHPYSTPAVGKREDAGRKSETPRDEGRIGLSAATEEIPPNQDPAATRDNGYPPDTPSASSSSSTKSHSSPSSLYSTPPTQCNGGSSVLTPETPASSSPPTRALDSRIATLLHGARRTEMMPCNLVQSHPLTTYRLREICPNCKKARHGQDGRLGLLKQGLKGLRMSVEGMVAVEDIQERDGQTHMEEEEGVAIPSELKQWDLNESADKGDASNEEEKASARSRSAMLKGG